jgi:chorismate synthase
MAGSSFGTLFRVTTFGESHCPGVGCIIDGCPPRMSLSKSDIQPQLTRRRPGQSRLTTPREETDQVTIQSGVEGGVTLGTPISLFVPNENTRAGDYAEMHTIPRPGHADYTYTVKYGVHAASGGGRSSARETIGRVAAGAVAEKWLKETYGTSIVTFVSSIGTVDMPVSALRQADGSPWTRQDVDTRGSLTILRCGGWKRVDNKTEQAALDSVDEADFVLRYARVTGPGTNVDDIAEDLRIPAYEDCDGCVYNILGLAIGAATDAAGKPSPLLPAIDIKACRTAELIPVRCPHASSAAQMASLIRSVKSRQDSTGGILTTVITNVPVGLGEPCFDKLEAKLAHAMMSLPATKGFEMGSGFAGTRMLGSQHNDPFVGTGTTIASLLNEGGAPVAMLATSSNNAGGTLGGISNGADIVFRVAIKPVSTISQAQTTASYDGTTSILEAKGRHDPCVLPRAPPLLEGMAALVLADAALIQRSRAPLFVLPAAPIHTQPGSVSNGAVEESVSGHKRTRDAITH